MGDVRGLEEGWQEEEGENTDPGLRFVLHAIGIEHPQQALIGVLLT
jgi:hypothetical protein